MSAGQKRVLTATLGPVAARGTPVRAIRISDDMWLPFADACKKQGKTPSEVVRECIRAYLDNHEDDTGGQDHAADDREQH